MNKAAYDIQDLWSKVVEESSPKAFELLFYALTPRLVKFSSFYVHQKELAEEIVSDVFLKVWTQKEALRHVRKAETYLFIAVKNQTLNYVKRISSVRLVVIDENAMHLVDTWQPDKEMENRELLFKLDQAIESLPQQCRIVFRLIKDEGMKYREVAEILGISPRTVQTQLFRAMKKLSVVMNPYINSEVKLGGLNISLAILLTPFFFA